MFDLGHKMSCKWQQNKSEAAFTGTVWKPATGCFLPASGDIWKEMPVNVDPLLGKNFIQDLWLIYLWECVFNKPACCFVTNYSGIFISAVL